MQGHLAQDLYSHTMIWLRRQYLRLSLGPNIGQALPWLCLNSCEGHVHLNCYNFIADRIISSQNGPVFEQEIASASQEFVDEF